MCPQASSPSRNASAERAASSRASRNQDAFAPLKIEGLAEYPGFMPTSRVRGVQTIVLDLTHIEDCLIAVWQALRHHRRLASHPVERKPISSSAPEEGGEYVDVQACFRPGNHSATAKQ